MRASIRLGLLTLGAALLLLTSGVGAQRAEESRTVVVLGVAAVQSGNPAAARDAAVAAGLQQAVARVAAEALSTEAFSESFRRLNEALLDRPEAFVQDFKVLSEAAAGKQLRVLVQATVPVRPIQELAARQGTAAPVAAPASTPLALAVEGTGNLANSLKFRRALVASPGVEGVQVKEMKPNETVLWVSYRGRPEDLVAALAAQSFDTFALNVVAADPAALKVALVPK
ncbi:MAG TPA: hypothetical protein VLH81_00120 [Desulfobacterales bacterium]|nr:hypothetical protein [Desulfobacterales bacterium]